MWHRKGNFQEIEGRADGDINRQMAYGTSSTDSLIKEIQFFGYTNGIVKLQLYLRNEASSVDFFQDINSACRVLLGVCVTVDGEVFFNRGSSGSFEEVLKILAEKSPGFDDILNEVLQIVKPVLTLEYSRVRFYQLRNDAEERMAYSYNPDAEKLSPLARAMKEEEERERNNNNSNAERHGRLKAEAFSPR